MTTTIDSYEWLDAIDRHPESTNTELLAAYSTLGAKTDLTPEELDASVFGLQMLGFLRPTAIEGDVWTYALALPERASRPE